MNPITVNEEKCIGCSLCVNDCPNACLYLKNGKAHAGKSGCIECGHCYAICPQGAIRLSSYPCEDEPVVSMTELDSETLLSAMRSRRTIRHFMDKPVEEERSERSSRPDDTVRPAATPKMCPIPFWEAGRRKRRRSVLRFSEEARSSALRWWSS